MSLLGNPGCPDQLTQPDKHDDEDYERYLLYAIYVLPETLRFLDSRTITHKERIIAKSRGKFLKTIKLSDVNSNVQEFDTVKSGFFNEEHFYINYTPLPETSRGSSDLKSK